MIKDYREFSIVLQIGQSMHTFYIKIGCKRNSFEEESFLNFDALEQVIKKQCEIRYARYHKFAIDDIIVIIQTIFDLGSEDLDYPLQEVYVKYKDKAILWEKRES